MIKVGTNWQDGRECLRHVCVIQISIPPNTEEDIVSHGISLGNTFQTI